MYNPLEQFTITPMIRIYNDWIDLTITNSTIMLLISVLTILLITKSYNNFIIVNKWERFIELTFKAVQDIVISILPGKYIPLIMNIFLFILLNNLIGLIPYSFTTTSHMAITLTLSLSIIIGVTFIGFRKHSIGFFKLFLPSGLNKGLPFLVGAILIPLIFVIELISYLTRIISLSVRLTANMMSGHTLLKIIANFGLQYTNFYPYILILIPLVLLIPVVILELGVAIIQAYVFTMLTASYIKDAELLH